jgi:hypothetical protein
MKRPATKAISEVDAKIDLTDRVFFAVRRFYNRTVGAYVLNWTHNRLMIFGISIMLKSTVDALNSQQARNNLKAGLSADEHRELCQALRIASVLPDADMPDGAFSDRRKAEYGIRLFWNHFYIFST